MDAALAHGMIHMIPFRPLLAIARALGGVGADPHRLPGGKSGLADALIARYGADAILRQWQSEQQQTPPPPATEAPTGADTGEGDRSEPSDDSGTGPQSEGDAQSKGESDGKGEARTGESGDTAEHGEAEGQTGDAQSEGRGDSDKQGEGETPADGETPPTGPEKAPADDSPEGCPTPAAPDAPPEKESPMDAAIREIAKQEAERAVYPVATWANATLLPHLAEQFARGPRQGGNTPPASESGPAGAPPRLPSPKMGRGEAMQHRLFPKLLALARAGVYPLMVGPAGTGKSYAARAAAAAMGRTYADQSLSAGVSESALTGWLLPIKEGSTCAYVPSPFVTAYETGNAVFLFDEIDAASPDMLVILNGALANGGFTVAQRFERPYVLRGADVGLMGAANTLTGADDSYSARSPIDKATLNRFYPLHWAHDDALEAHMMGIPSRQRYWKPEGITEWIDTAWQTSSKEARRWVGAVRATIERGKLSHVFSSRQSMMYQAALSAGFTHKEIREDLLFGWGPDEVAKLSAADQPKNAPAVGAEIEAV